MEQMATEAGGAETPAPSLMTDSYPEPELDIECSFDGAGDDTPVVSECQPRNRQSVGPVEPVSEWAIADWAEIDLERAYCEAQTAPRDAG